VTSSSADWNRCSSLASQHIGLREIVEMNPTTGNCLSRQTMW